MEKRLENIIKEIQSGEKEQVQITPRVLFNDLGCERRTINNCNYVDSILEENELEIEPHYNDVWIDVEITLRQKKKAKRKICKDPIKKLKVLEAAVKEPTIINNDATLNEAITLMMLHKYSQLPVTTGGVRNLVGYISWETIGNAIVNGVSTGIVKDYTSKDVKTLTLDTPLLQAIKLVYDHEFIIVLKDKAICGIVTMADISSQFLASTEPFLCLEQIENQIRQIFDGKFLLEEIKKISAEPDRKIESLDDLTFGEYIRLIEDPKNWESLNIKSVDRALFVKYLDKIRLIRNDIMHFEPAGITKEQQNDLKKMTDYLGIITKYNC